MLLLVNVSISTNVNQNINQSYLSINIDKIIF